MKFPIKFVPKTIPAAKRALAFMYRDLDSDKPYDAIRKLECMAEAMKILFAEVTAVRRDCERFIILANHRYGEELTAMPVAKAGRPKLIGNTVLPISEPTLAELAGYKMRGHRLKKLASIDKDAVAEAIEEIQDSGKEATVNGVIKLVAGHETKRRRNASRNASPLPDGVDFRPGDCRDVLADIADNSLPLVLTDPPYGDEAEPLYQWLAEWCARVLIPGGSLICYTGQARLNRDVAIFDQYLRYWWLLSMQYSQSQRFPGKFVMAGFKPVLWYVKAHRRGRGLVSDVLRDNGRDKSEHDWGQGLSGVPQLIEDLTSPGEVIVDPFAGSCLWGRISASMGRRWIGADIERGGTTTVAAE